MANGVWAQVKRFLWALLRSGVSRFLFLLAVGSTLATYIPTYLTGFAVPRWLPGLCLVAAFLWGSFDVFRAQSHEIDSLTGENSRLKNRIDILENNVDAAKAKLLSDLIAELEENLHTAQSFYSGTPGNQVYLPPSIDAWKRIRSGLTFLDEGLRNELKEVYEKIQRWEGIVGSGLNPGIGSPEIPDITQTLKRSLPNLLARLKSARDATEDFGRKRA